MPSPPSSEPPPQRLPQSVEFARALLDHLQDSVLLMDAENHIRFVTPSYEALLGYAPGALLGTRAGERVHPEDRQGLQEAIEAIWREKGHARQEHRLLALDGSLRYVRASGSYLADGAPWCPGPCLLASIHDLSQERAAQAQLKASEHFLRMLVENLHDAILIVGPDAKLYYVSTAYERLSGWTAEEMKGTHSFSRIHPDDQAHIRESLGEVLKSSGQTFAAEYRLLTKAGGILDVETRARLLPDGFPGAEGPCLSVAIRDRSTEKRAERQLAESERFHRSIIDNLQDGLLLLDMEQRPRYVSPGYAKTFGYQTSGVLGLPPSTRVHADDLATVRRAFEQAVAQGGSPVMVELRLIGQDGTVRAAQSSLRYLPDGMPSYPGPSVLVLARDVTEQRNTRQALEASERFLRELVDNLHDAVIIGAADGRIVYVSPAYERLTGWTPQDMLGSSPRARVHPDDADRFRQAMQGVLQSGQRSLPGQYRAFTKDGRLIEVLIQLRLLPDGMPGLAGPLVLGAVRDRSAEAAAERLLADRERFFRAIIDNLQDGVIILGLDQRVRFVSPTYASLAGHSIEAMQAQSPGDRIYSEDLPRAKASFTETIANPHQAKVTEYRLKRPDGSLLWVRAVSRYLPEGIPGNPEPCMLIVARDVQVERQSEQELRRFERLALLGEMTAGLAHELRNPLMAISATAELLRGSSDLGEESQQDVDTILVQARRLRELLDQTLSKRKVQEPQAVPAESALRVAAGLARRSFGPTADKVTQTLEVAKDTPAAWGEPGPLQQVFLNLILNALQAMPQGGHLELGAKAQDGGALFSVVDTGPGVPPEALANIFDPFFTTKSYGSGLGLSVSRRIVEGHGGRLWAERLEKGMAFYAWIPGPPIA